MLENYNSTIFSNTCSSFYYIFQKKIFDHFNCHFRASLPKRRFSKRKYISSGIVFEKLKAKYLWHVTNIIFINLFLLFLLECIYDYLEWVSSNQKDLRNTTELCTFQLKNFHHKKITFVVKIINDELKNFRLGENFWSWRLVVA